MRRATDEYFSSLQDRLCEGSDGPHTQRLRLLDELMLSVELEQEGD